MALERTRRTGQAPPARGAESVLARRPNGASSVLALQQMAGNRAAGQVLARKQPPGKPTDKQVATDYQNAYMAVDLHFDRVKAILDLEDKVRQQAIQNYAAFGKLKDPPSLAEAIVKSVFETALMWIPGTATVKAALTSGFFVLDMAQLRRKLTDNPLVGANRANEAIKHFEKKGPYEKHRQKGEKASGYADKAAGVGKGVYDAKKKHDEEVAAAQAAEAEAKELAGLNAARVANWSDRASKATLQKEAITEWLKDAHAKDLHPGGLEKVIREQLGPAPPLTEQVRPHLERAYELELYRQKLRWVTTTTTYFGGGARERSSSADTLELDDGGKPSKALRERIAFLMNQPLFKEEQFSDLLAKELKVPTSSRSKREKNFPLEPTRPGAGG